MAVKKRLDGEVGPLPRITMDGQRVIYTMSIVGIDNALALRFRCDPDGEVHVSITPTLPMER